MKFKIYHTLIGYIIAVEDKQQKMLIELICFIVVM